MTLTHAFVGSNPTTAATFLQFSYLSKTSFIDDEYPTKLESYKGKRIQRGLFRTMDGMTVNADSNGAMQIIRKHNKDYICTDINKTIKLMKTPIRIKVS